MKILKFGGKSLANGQGVDSVLSIIKKKNQQKQPIVIVVSARANTTDQLENFLEQAKQGKNISADWETFKNYQRAPSQKLNFETEFTLLENIFQGVKLLEDYSPKVKDLVLAQGELLSAKTLVTLLNQNGIKSEMVDSRKLFTTDNDFGHAHINESVSEKQTLDYFKKISTDTTAVVTGFIAATTKGNTTTLGRNGSNYTASLLAKYLNADEVESYTHLNGIYTANPDQVHNAKIIGNLNFQEAGELAGFGATILHSKTIVPLIEKNIPLRILNTFVPEGKGTFISTGNQQKGVKAITVQDQVCIISIVGKGFLGKIGVDARIFRVLNDRNISVGVVSQGSSERGVDFIINKTKAAEAVSALKTEFAREFANKDVSSITAIHDIAVVTIIGQDLQGFNSSYQALTRNGIEIILINNTLNGKNIGLVIHKKDINKTLNVVHGQIFGIAKNINIAIFGKGQVGGSLINQIIKSKSNILKRKETNLNIFAIAGSNKVLLNHNGIGASWDKEIEQQATSTNIEQEVMTYACTHHLENLVVIDNTASGEFTNNYIDFITAGFDIVSSNKKANTNSYLSYKELRKTLKRYNKQYLYETNVGAGLPLIDTIKLLHDSGENITRIRGVFSGSLSFLFNTFSAENRNFDNILLEAIANGYTEPDAREDLCGNDVARKLLILARELDLANEFDEILIDNLIPKALRDVSVDEFKNRLHELNPVYNTLKKEQKSNHVLRYVGDLAGDLQQEKGELSVQLVSVPENSALGQLKGSDSIFEIYTESYGRNPIVIQGAGAGAEVTARGVFGDLLRIADKK